MGQLASYKNMVAIFVYHVYTRIPLSMETKLTVDTRKFGLLFSQYYRGYTFKTDLRYVKVS